MKDKLSVCMIISSFYPKIGGAERQAQQLAARLLGSGVDVCILTRRYQGLEKYGVIDGVPVYRMPIIGTGIFAALSYIFSCLFWLFKHQNRFQIAHCHQAFSPATIGIISKTLWKKKVIVKIATSGKYGDIAEIKKLPLPALRKILLEQVDIFIALNQEVEPELREFGLTSNRVEYIPNGVDIEMFASIAAAERNKLRDNLTLPVNDKLVVFTGRLHHKKKIDILLRAWAKVVSLISMNIKLLLIGEGPEEARLRELTAQLNLETKVSFLGQREKIYEYLQVADVFVFPSVSEGMSNSLLEAMACCLPPVATRVGGNAEIIEDGENGLLVPPDDPVKLARALEIVLQDQALASKLGNAARQTVVQKYSLESVTEQYLHLYRRLLVE